ncbi:phosphoglycerate mutase family protein [Patescibacteria group bacterium]|nr:phosphoglycerate mutase family protein [Patescibacteria group bacterium]
MNQGKVVYFVRHAQTEHNRDGVTGCPSDELSATGRRQAGLLAERLNGIGFDRVISSTYVRAQQTAEVLARHHDKEIIFSDLLVEVRSPSELCGKSRNDPDVLSIRKLRFDNWGNPDWKFSDEENFFDAQNRAKKAMEFLENQEDRLLVVVTHGAFMRAIANIILVGIQPTAVLSTPINQTLKTYNTGLTTISISKEGQWFLECWNDTRHLEPAATEQYRNASLTLLEP